MKTRKLKRTLKLLFAKRISQRQQSFYKGTIRCFFDDNDNLPNLISLGITNLKFRKIKNQIEITITLERPGLLIGKGGSTINKLSEFLSNCPRDYLPVKINIIESKLWRYKS